MNARDEQFLCGEVGCDLGFGIGYFLAVMGALAIAAGGYMFYAQEKEAGR